jgi:hypothetical protein
MLKALKGSEDDMKGVMEAALAHVLQASLVMHQPKALKSSFKLFKFSCRFSISQFVRR